MSKQSLSSLFVSAVKDYALPTAVFAGFFLLWEAVTRIFAIPEFILPSPSRTVEVMLANFPIIIRHSYATLEATLIGFGLSIVFGLLLGLAVGYSAIIYRAVYPLLVAFNTIPKVAIVPILVIWFGIGKVPAVLTAFLISFFPIVVNVAVALATIEPEIRDVLRSLGASKTQIFVKIGVPRSMPYFFGSLKVASTLAFVGAVISESVASNEGTGYLMIAASSRFDVPLVFAGLLVISFIGISLFLVFAILEKRLVGWAYR
ncbi:MAG: ABC transporter permease [Candidatus Caldarchaeum sp.]|uniref:ABC transporter permease n=1 Tax=Caldiarchaeum subterraneum TaxID=311458 RepID=A0A7C4I5T5_CALS0|nr:ABC transporter permease [Candidatus Caldarchaeales archaeon]